VIGCLVAVFSSVLAGAGAVFRVLPANRRVLMRIADGLMAFPAIRWHRDHGRARPKTST